MEPDEELHHLLLIYAHPNWSTYIKPKLESLSSMNENPMKIINILKAFQLQSYTIMNKMGKKSLKIHLQGLYQIYQKQLPDVFSMVAEYVLSMEEKPPKIPLSKTGIAFEHTFEKSQILLVVCCMALMIIPHQNENFAGRIGMLKDFSYIFSVQEYKTRCIIEYLKQELTQWKKQKKYSKQKLTIKRHRQPKPLEEVIEAHKETPMKKATVCHDKDSIENYYGYVKVDFANKYIGGGSLTAGCVQEQIMFANRPQLYTPMILCEVMAENQAIIFSGFRKYFKNKGYAETCEYNGKQEHQYEFHQNQANQYITAIDAVHFPRKNDLSQFSDEFVNRQLMKAYVGFSGSRGERVITGNWGCGAFNGDIRLKFLIQWIAASMAKKQMFYAPFGSKDKLEDKEILEFVEKRTVAEVYAALRKGCEKMKNGKESIFQKILSK